MDTLGFIFFVAMIPFGLALWLRAVLPWVSFVLGFAGLASPVLWVGGVVWAFVAR